MSTAQLQRLAAGLVVAGAVMTMWCLLVGQRSLAPSWDAVKTVASVVSSVWLWAAVPRITFDDARDRGRVEPECARIADCGWRCSLNDGHAGDCWHCGVNGKLDPRLTFEDGVSK